MRLLPEGMQPVIKGWRAIFYAVIGLAVLSIAYITISYIQTERLVKATGNPKLEVRQRAARKIMGGAARNERGREKAITFLRGQPQTVRNNVVWSIEQLAGQGGQQAEAVKWLVELAGDLSGDVPTAEGDWDVARLAVQRLGQPAVADLCQMAVESTQRTREKDVYAHRRAVAVRLLGLIADKGSIDALKLAIRDDYEEVRQQAAAALARLNVPDAQQPLNDYLEPLRAVLRGEYQCYVRLDSEGRITKVPDRTKLVYGPFVVRVKPHEQATMPVPQARVSSSTPRS